MKTKLVLFFISMFTLLSLPSHATRDSKSTKQEVVLDVPMTCESCKKKIEKNISFEKGVTDMKVDLSNKTVTIQFNSNKTDLDKIKKAFAQLGYETSIHQPETTIAK